MRRHKYRRIKPTPNCTPQGYQLSLIALGVTSCLSVLILFIDQKIPVVSPYLGELLLYSFIASVVSIIIFFYMWNRREKVSSIEIPTMAKKAKKLSKRLRRLYNDKQITDVLKLSNTTRYGQEMPEIEVWVDEDLSNGYVAIENISNWERADRANYNQRVSGIFTGRYQQFSVVDCELTADDSFILFHFEDTLTSSRITINDNSSSLKQFVSEDEHAIRLSEDLVWHTDITSHLSLIARTRAGKSVFAGRYLARLMLLQGWIVEYNSAKFDRYVTEFHGESDPLKIVERAEYWCTVMDERLRKINEAGKEKYLEMDDMPHIGLFFDELANLNASCESLDKTDKSLKITARWITAINRLSATGASSGISLIAISQFATKEAFLPSLARVNCSDAVIMLGGAADSATERQYLMSGFSDMPKRSYGKGQGLARIVGSGRKWENSPHFFETPWFEK